MTDAKFKAPHCQAYCQVKRRKTVSQKTQSPRAPTRMEPSQRWMDGLAWADNMDVDSLRKCEGDRRSNCSQAKCEINVIH